MRQPAAAVRYAVLRFATGHTTGRKGCFSVDLTGESHSCIKGKVTNRLQIADLRVQNKETFFYSRVIVIRPSDAGEILHSIPSGIRPSRLLCRKLRRKLCRSGNWLGLQNLEGTINSRILEVQTSIRQRRRKRSPKGPTPASGGGTGMWLAPMAPPPNH